MAEPQPKQTCQIFREYIRTNLCILTEARRIIVWTTLKTFCKQKRFARIAVVALLNFNNQRRIIWVRRVLPTSSEGHNGSMWRTLAAKQSRFLLYKSRQLVSLWPDDLPFRKCCSLSAAPAIRAMRLGCVPASFPSNACESNAARRCTYARRCVARVAKSIPRIR
jgi:hypothetical protein